MNLEKNRIRERENVKGNTDIIAWNSFLNYDNLELIIILVLLLVYISKHLELI